MEIQVLSKVLDESSFCPLCNAAVYFVEGEFNDHDLQFSECSYCSHRVFPENNHTCHCDTCTTKRKKIIKETSAEEKLAFKHKKKHAEDDVVDLHQLSFLQKLFLLSVLDEMVQEGRQYDEYINWGELRTRPITPSYMFQGQLLKNLVKENILVPTEFTDDCQKFYINIRLDGYADPSIYSITNRLRQLFFENLTQGVPFRTADEVKDALYFVLYQEVVQFAQYYCRSWGVQISGSKTFQKFCVEQLDNLAVGQLIFLTQNALEYLRKQNVLQARNDNFINTNLLRKTLEQYRKKMVEERWETTTLPRPEQYPKSKMSEILLHKFLGYDDSIFVQPVTHSWGKIHPRITFYAVKRCMNCGSNDLKIEYDQGNQVTMACYDCKHTDHYFITDK